MSKKIFVDVDKVLCTQQESTAYDKAEPIYENIAKINKLYDDGHTIIIWTARGSTTGIDWSAITAEQMHKWGVHFHELRIGKPAYDFIIDDRALSGVVPLTNIEDV